jgi:two-component system cell cycle sensor histidine kinase PleC
MPAGSDCAIRLDPERSNGIAKMRRQKTVLKTGALQHAMLGRASGSGIATDEQSAVRIFKAAPGRAWGAAAGQSTVVGSCI